MSVRTMVAKARAEEQAEPADWLRDLIEGWAARKPKLAECLRKLHGDLNAMEAQPANEFRRGDSTPWWLRDDGSTLAADWRCAIYARQVVGGPMWILNEAKRAGWMPTAPTADRLAALRRGSVSVQCRALGHPEPAHARSGSHGYPGMGQHKIAIQADFANDGTRYDMEGEA